MTKLTDWLSVGVAFFCVYFVITLRKVENTFFDKWMFEIKILPLILLFGFGVYSVVIILYRVFTFNDCDEAAKELFEQIKEAKSDLRAKGIDVKD
uniref:Dolichol-phosphate mannosyltransferase subunit 3 n=1 Tax=Corethrella appendiculata TaxID=1370023 RepID=U5ERS9_9DIPT